VAHGVFRGVRDGGDRELDPEGPAADRAPALGLERDEPVVDLFGLDIKHDLIEIDSNESNKRKNRGLRLEKCFLGAKPDNIGCSQTRLF
jgi:hypothetical protein